MVFGSVVSSVLEVLITVYLVVSLVDINSEGVIEDSERLGGLEVNLDFNVVKIVLVSLG